MQPSTSRATASSPAGAPSRSSSRRRSSARGSRAFSGGALSQAAPGIFYVFRDEAEEQSFAISRVSRRRRAPGIEECRELAADHEDLLDPLIAFFTERGRLPTPRRAPDRPATQPCVRQRRPSVLPAPAGHRRRTLGRAPRPRARRPARVPRPRRVPEAPPPRRAPRGASARHPRLLRVLQVRLRRRRRAAVLGRRPERGRPRVPPCAGREAAARRPLRPPHRRRPSAPGAAGLRRLRPPARRAPSTG